MQPISFRFAVAAVSGAALIAASISPAAAGGFYTGSVPSVSGGVSVSGAGAPGGYGGGGGSGGGCHGGGGGGSTIIINKNININKPVNINKNININKVVVINKVNVEASAFAQALAAANAGAAASVVIYGGGSYEYVNVRNEGGGGVAAAASAHCEMQEATVVKSIHAVCIAADGREFPASHMTGETWINSGYEGEVARCIAGSHLKITIGDVVQSDQGMAGTYTKGVILECGEHEAVRHFKGGMLKCAPAMPVPDCTERTNLRKWGTGDMFFTYISTVCATRAVSREIELDNAALGGGGVGESGGY
ncbi:MAG TPA: hypothetical protein VFV07_10455 [Rhizomicrobium sp.]|nr:hypothetical protein [Rhizomicrobium sp.]